jgi:hypothetical protein
MATPVQQIQAVAAAVADIKKAHPMGFPAETAAAA